MAHQPLDMKVLFVATEALRYRWEVELMLFNMQRIGFRMHDTIWLAYGEQHPETDELVERYGIELHRYEDDRPRHAYPTSSRPWLIAKFLREDPARSEFDYFYVDSDIIFSRMPDLDQIPVTATTWYGSQTSHYTGPDVVLAQGGQAFFDTLVEVSGVTEKGLAHLRMQTPGAQWVLGRPTPEFFERTYEMCEDMYTRLVKVRDDAREAGTPIKANPWLTDMWATTWTAESEGMDMRVTPRLNFTLANNALAWFEKYSIYHNSGVTPAHARAVHLFCKDDWADESPFGKEHLMNPRCASLAYVREMQLLDPSTKIVLAED